MDNHSPLRQRRRRRDFVAALQQSRAAGPIPLVEIGPRLRDIRVQCGYSIRMLAQKSGLNVNTLSMIENGKTSPSLETLQQLSFALETPMTTFFEANTPEPRVVYHQANRRPRVAFAYGTLEDLGTGIPRRGVEAFLVTLKPHSNSGEELMAHTGREVVFCLEGQLTYIIEAQTFVLEPGDSLFFDAYLPHRWQNTGSIPARSLLVLCPADEQDRPTERHFTPGTGDFEEPETD